MADTPVKLLDLKTQFEPLKREMVQVAAETIESGWFLLGKRTEEFEGEFARWLNIRHAAGCANGTDALTLALWALGVGEGDEVITVPNTAFPTACAISRCGGRPVFVDIDPETWLMDPDKASAAVTPRTKAVLPVHLYGQLVDLPKLREMIPREIPILEDCAQAHGATLAGRKAGTMGNLAAFSFYPSKNLGALGDGGIVVSDTEDLDTSVRELRFYGQTARDLHRHSGMNSRLDEIQAAFLSLELRYLDDWLAARRRTAALYDRTLRNQGFHLPVPVADSDPAFHLYVVQVENRAALRSHLESAGIQHGIHYPKLIPYQPAYSSLGYVPGDFPHAERLASRILSLPVAPHLTDAETERVVQACLSFPER